VVKVASPPSGLGGNQPHPLKSAMTRTTAMAARQTSLMVTLMAYLFLLARLAAARTLLLLEARPRLTMVARLPAVVLRPA
jgi:hypothetical protein